MPLPNYRGANSEAEINLVHRRYFERLRLAFLRGRITASQHRTLRDINDMTRDILLRGLRN